MSIPTDAPQSRPFTIRRATRADVSALQELSITTFTQTFGFLYAPDDLQDFLESTYSPDALTSLLTDPQCAVWLAFDAGVGGDTDPDAQETSQPVAYVLAGPCSLPHPDVRSGDGEIKRLYVRQGLQNSGLGTQVMFIAVDWLLERQPDALWLGVWSRNDRAQRFYERFGFTHAGEYRFKVGCHRDHEFIFKRALHASLRQ